MKYYSLLILLALLIASTTHVHAQSMSNPSYNLDLDTNTSQDRPQETEDPQVVPQATSKNISGDNFIVLSSYTNDINNVPLVMSLSTNVLNFGQVKPGEPLIRSNTVKVLPGASQGYQVVSYQNHNLAADQFQIPNTSCDNGACTAILPDSWSIPLTYGFGYRCDNVSGSACEKGFATDYYKRFANDKLNEQPAPILRSLSSQNAESILSYKINIPGTQEQKAYQTTIYYIAVPSL